MAPETVPARNPSAPPDTPVPAASAEIVAFIRSLGQIVANAHLYSIHHPVTVEALEHSYETFHKVMATRDTMNIAMVNDQLLVDGQNVEMRSSQASTFADKLRAIDLAGFSLDKSVSADEFVRLVWILATPATTVRSVNVVEQLSGSGFEHVKAKVVRYTQLSEGDEVISGKEAAIGRQFTGPMVEQIMAFLKGDAASTENSPLRNVDAAADNAQMLADMIVKSAVIRERSPDLGHGESLGGLIVGCLRRTINSLSEDPVTKTQKGKKTLAKTLVVMEKEILVKLRGMAGDSAGAETELVEAAREMQDELAMDSLAEQYAKKMEAVGDSERRILRYIKRKGINAASESGLRERLIENGVSSEGWRELVVKSGALDGTGGKSESSADTGRILAVLLTQLSELVDAKTDPGRQTELTKTIAKLGGEVDRTVAETERKIQVLSEEARRVEADDGISNDAAAGGAGKMSRQEILRSLAEIGQELCQPLTIINCCLGVLSANRLGELNEPQRRTLRLAADNGKRLSALVTKLMGIFGFPADSAPDQEIIGKLRG
jgi:hypothetical protein